MTQDPMPHPDARSDEDKQDYEAPSVEEVDTEDSPAVTAAGVDSRSDMRLKRSLRTLDGAVDRLR